MFKELLSLILVFFLMQGCAKDKKRGGNNPQTPVEQTRAVRAKDENIIETVRLGDEVVVEGNVMRDENGLYAIKRLLRFSLNHPSYLKIRKTFSMDLCGRSRTEFFIVKGESEVVDSITIDLINGHYDGIPEEKFHAPLFAGDYHLLVYVTLQEECINRGFAYRFQFLEY